ncbi:MAG: class I SAM-dependent methyltransferase [Nitrospinae bacterium]|nr:class I SAM-dependent methyltransferase [Nitrospinota bacterium]
MSGWPPPPLAFPDEAGDVAGWLSGVVEDFLRNPPLLSAEALAQSVEDGPAELIAPIAEGQKALQNGRLSDAVGLLEPVAVNHPHSAALTGLVMAGLGLYQKAVFYWESLAYMLPKEAPQSLYLSLINLGRGMIKQNPSWHPEADAFTLLCRGKGIDVGCGGNKTCPEAIGVDLTPGGAKGAHGGQKSVTSSADVVASGDYLPMFGGGELDYVIARHNLEHYKDHVKALKEWVRVLKPGGLLGVAVPDHGWVDTIRLDPTHYHAFTLDSLQRLFGLLPSMRVAYAGGLVPRWSIMAVAVKTPEPEPFNYIESGIARDIERLRQSALRQKMNGREWLCAECAVEEKRLTGAGD